MIGENTKIIYSPRLWSKPLHEGKERWKVIVAHRRSGKTFASINHLIRDIHPIILRKTIRLVLVPF